MYFLASDAAKSITGVNIPVDQVLHTLHPLSASPCSERLIAFGEHARAMLNGEGSLYTCHRHAPKHDVCAVHQGWACGAIGEPKMPEQPQQ